MIDIHTHILPGVDDGPKDWDDTFNLLRQGAEDGIKGAVCTSHLLDHCSPELEELFTQRFADLQVKLQAEKIEMALWLAAEIYCQADFQPESAIVTFSGKGKYSLIELPLGQIPQNAGEVFFNLSLKGITPILAHPERNMDIAQKIDLARDYCRRGILLQVNAGSLLGVFGSSARKTAFALFDNELVSFVASDCHHFRNRPMLLSAVRTLVTKKWGSETATRVFEINPLKTVNGEAIPAIDPPSQKKTGFWKKIFTN